MLDIGYIRNNVDEVKKAVKTKRLASRVDIDALLQKEKAYRAMVTELEGFRAEQNSLSKMVAGAAEDERQKLIDQMTTLKEKIRSHEDGIKPLEKDFKKLMMEVPNVYDPESPEGKDDEDNKVIETSETKPKTFGFTPKDHVDLGADLDIIDIERATKVSGARFNYIKGDLALVQFALIQLTMQALTSTRIIKRLADSVGNPHATPFTPIVPPQMMKPSMMRKMDRLDPVEERYLMKEDDLVLVGSAEHTIGAMFANEVLDLSQGPIRFIGYSTSYRREAGSYGKDTRGILRVHQFDKLEMETFSTQEDGRKEHDLLVAIQRYLMDQLELPYQVVLKCTGDMGKPNYRAIDIETWIPTQEKYRETHSADFMTDYQSRRLGTKYKTKDGKKELVHMNDATGFAIGRILIAIMENYQQEDGSIKIPKALVKYVGKKEIRKPA